MNRSCGRGPYGIPINYLRAERPRDSVYVKEGRGQRRRDHSEGSECGQFREPYLPLSLAVDSLKNIAETPRRVPGYR